MRTLILVLLIITVPLSAANYYWVDFRGLSTDAVSVLVSEGYDFTARDFKTGICTFLLTKAEMNSLAKHGYYGTITSKFLARPLDPEYHDYDELGTEIYALQNANPNIVKVYDIGDSWAKATHMASHGGKYREHDIMAVKLTRDPACTHDRPKVLFVGLHHAREPISLEVPLYFLNWLVQQYNSGNTEVQSWINNTEIWFVPLLNPDGHRLVWLGNTSWRKNVRENDVNSYYGVDPNRNYRYKWGGSGSSGNKTSNTYRGPSPLSEYETQAIINLYEGQHVNLSHSFHSYGQVVLYPWAWAYENAPDNATLRNIAQNVASLSRYSFKQSSSLYPHAGELNDDLYYTDGILGITTELATTFIPPGSQIQAICERNLEAMKYMVKRVHTDGVTGKITNARNGNPLVAQVKVQEIWNASKMKPRMSEATYGRYLRMLVPGTYTFEFSKSGYITQVHQVTINNDQLVTLDVQLTPDGTGFNTYKFQKIPKATVQLSPNPARNYVNLSIVPSANGNGLIEIFNVEGRLVYKKKLFGLKAGFTKKMHLHTNKFAAGTYCMRFSVVDRAQEVTAFVVIR